MINSQQIGNIKTFNSLMGGLATNTTSLLMGGNANFNLLSFKGVGMLEFSFGKDGIKSKIGMGGTNISLQNLVGAFGGATNLHKNSQINNTGYDKTVLDALRSQWGFGDKTAKKQLEEIIKGDTILKLDAAGSEVAQSINENGQKIIHLNSSQNDGFIDLGLTLQHEAHRDGIISDKQGQYIETVNAVEAHTKMALAMTKDSLYTKEMLNHISSDTNLQNDINAYMYAAYTGNTSLFAGYVGASYDSSADYWKLKMYADGTHELIYDGEKELSIDYLNENGEVISTSVPEKQDMTGIGMAESLTTILGSDRAQEILKNQFGLDAKSVNDVPNEIMASVMGWPIDTVNSMPDHIKASILTENKDAIMGELLMTQMGASWNGSSWINTEGISLTITDKTYNGNIMAEVQNGKYLYSTVNATLFRDPDSWNSIVGTPDKDDPSKIIWENYDDYSNLDVRVFTKTGINWDFNESYVDVGVQSIDNMFQSISNPEKSSEYNQAYYDKNTQKWVQGNTIMSEYYNMQYYSTSGSYEGFVLVKNNAWTIDGNWVGNEGKDSRSDDRWLSHANRKYGEIKDWLTTRSDGCDIQSYESYNLLFNQFKNWNMSNNYQIRTQLINQKYGGY